MRDEMERLNKDWKPARYESDALYVHQLKEVSVWGEFYALEE